MMPAGRAATRFLTGLSVGLTCGTAALAQDSGGPQGTVLTFNVGERLQYSDNLDLTPVSLGPTTEAITLLDFGLSKATDNSTLNLVAGVQLIFADPPPGSTSANGWNNPYFGLDYQLFSAASSLDFNLDLRQTTLDQIRDVTDFDTGTGVRGNYLIGAAINWGLDAPFGFGLTAGYEDINYIDTSNPDLIDAQRTDLGANASLALSPTSRLTLGINRSEFLEDGAASPDLQITGSLGLSMARANGDDIAANVFVDNTETGTREGLSVQYAMALPNGSLTFTPGLTRATTGKVYWTSDFLWQQTLPSGNFSAQWSQEVTSQNENDEEVVLSDVGLSYTRAVNPLNSLTFNLDWAQQVYTVDNSTDTNASFGAVWTRALTPDWNLDVGYLYRISDGQTEDSAESNTLYLELNRAFGTEY